MNRSTTDQRRSDARTEAQRPFTAPSSPGGLLAGSLDYSRRGGNAHSPLHSVRPDL